MEQASHFSAFYPATSASSFRSDNLFKLAEFTRFEPVESG
jgi:hypothetical protein